MTSSSGSKLDLTLDELVNADGSSPILVANSLATILGRKQLWIDPWMKPLGIASG